MRVDLLGNNRVRTGLAVIAFFALLAVFGPFLLGLFGLDASAHDMTAISQPPSAAHPLGTTQFGQDVLAQVVAGARGSMFVGVLAAAIGTGIAILVGVPSGYFGGAVDTLLNFLTNLFLVMPVLPLIFVIAGYTQGAGLWMIALIIGCFGWAGGARTLRAQTMSLRNRDFVAGMRMLGEGDGRLIASEILPHLTGLVSSMFLHAMIGAVLAEAGLAFLGVSDAAATSWGTMIQSAQAQSAILRGLWWWFIPPGLCIALLGTAAALVNFGVDELSNPKLRLARRSVVRRTKRVSRRVARSEA